MQDASIGRREKDNRVSRASMQGLTPLTGSSSPSEEMTPDSDSDAESEIDGEAFGEREDAHRAFELKSILRRSSEEGRQSTLPNNELNEESDSEEEKHNDPRRTRRASESTVQSFMLYTPDEERAVVKKLDRRLVLFLALLYMSSFLDRSNIGNAKIAGLSEDLQLTSSQFEWLLTAFYITYILFEWMTLLYRVFPAHIYIALCVASWGLIASFQSVANSFSSMLILRALLGISEAAFGPGVPFYMSFFFKREELALRTGLFISAAPLATSFASTLAYAITWVGDRSPIAAWRMLFLVEGFPSMIVAAFAWYYMPDSPGTARYLSRREKKVATLRLRKEKDTENGKPTKRKLNLREILSTLVDPKCYITAIMFLGCNVAFSSLPVFLPTILEEMGYSELAAQGLSAPPYLFAFFVVLVTAWLSDRYRNRSAFVCFHAMLAACGYLMIAIAGWRKAGIAWRYGGIFPATAGFFSAITIIITWTINNQDSDSKKGTGVAMLNVLGQFGPLIGTRLYPDSDKPYYIRGMSICAGFMFAVLLLSLGLRFILARENRRTELLYMKVGEEDEEGLVSIGYTKKDRGQFRFML